MKYRVAVPVLCSLLSALLMAASPPAQAIVGGTDTANFGQLASGVAQPVPESACALLLIAGLAVLMRKAHRGMNTRLALSGARRQASRYRSAH
ncbi:hypothetical protein ACFJGW_04820 [Burkholderiaceae bacterium UC74_6]